ncbi:Dyp-type peroxidase [Rathayibacter sp. YIM 133350]|uniref:Dyp-type peroxidase n=1 Tax=Rathayibacter sp. YIM 133350 TaxID=3131992 RepID=UPI00307E3E18
MPDAWDRTPIEVQSIDAPLSTAAIFLVVTVAPTPDAVAAVRAVLADVGGLVRTVGFRDLKGRLSCVVGIGSDAWDRVTGLARPAQLRPFVAVTGSAHTAPSTPGDLLFHIRADRPDMCFEFERLLLAALGDAVSVVDETPGFRYFDSRDLLGFVDGTANPTGPDMLAWTAVADDPVYNGGSYVVAQKYVHDLDAWSRLGTEMQEAIMGRTKPDNVELDDAPSGQKSHKTLATIVDEEGTEHDILRDNMPFGRPGSGEFGTYFIGYARDLWVIERMLSRMFIGDPPGAYDRMLDVSTAVTGGTFFAPPSSVLDSLA